MLIRMLDAAHYKPAIVGWQNSRDNSPVEPAIVGVDAPVNELPTALLEFKDFMILEREIFTCARNHVLWARTSRVDDPLLFTVPYEFFDVHVHKELRERMRMAKVAGASQDQWRMHLPLVSHTSWTARMSFRDLIKMHKYFGYLAQHREIVPVLRVRFKEVSKAIYDIIVRIMESSFLHAPKLADEAIGSMKLVKFLNERPIYAISEEFSNGNFRLITALIPVALRAQLVRHREVHFIDDFFTYLCLQHFSDATIGNNVMLQAAAKNEVWESIIGKRACWIAQADLWQPIVDRFASAALPCLDGHCPYEVDAAARLVAGKDPNPPCPRYCNLKGIAKAPYKERMHAALAERKHGAEMQRYWEKEISK